MATETDTWYREWTAPPDLARHVVCTWAGRFGDAGERYVDRVLPDGCIDVVWTEGHLIVAGPDTRCVPLPPRPGARFVGIRFRTGFAPAVLGVSASALCDTQASLADVIGSRAARVGDDLDRAPTPRAAGDVLAGAVRRWLPDARSPDPLVEAAVAIIRSTESARPVGALARQLGVSERQLHRRFLAAVGYGPKLLHRIQRFRRFLRLGAAGAANGDIARLALDAGYADHAHLAHDCHQLAGLPPGRLAGGLITAA
jgi:AraC-like DNA-binding protein